MTNCNGRSVNSDNCNSMDLINPIKNSYFISIGRSRDGIEPEPALPLHLHLEYLAFCSFLCYGLNT
jgi:hypothetical protein